MRKKLNEIVWPAIMELTELEIKKFAQGKKKKFFWINFFILNTMKEIIFQQEDNINILSSY